MIKRATLVTLSVFSVCFPPISQQASPWPQTGTATLDQLNLYRPEVLSMVDSAKLVAGLPMLALLNEDRLPISTPLGRMGMASTDISFAFADAAPVQKINASRVDPKDSPREVMPSQVTPEFLGGEVGVFYGRSTGKFGGDAWGSYIESSFGTDKYQISVGASYEEFDRRGSRWSR
jgi:hypothetical protein